ncbi:MAG: CBS domain-containing protein [Hydrogenibacillus sp.]|nr:CBS domain-containing protein [Hydrogenibacillus sp.]
MAGRVVTARHDDTLRTVAKRMREHEIGALPVLGADDQLIGIVTDRDIVRRAVADGRPDTTKAAEVMTPNPVTISPEESTRTAAKIMSERQIRRLPVVEGERVVGMLAVKDLTEDQASLKMVDTVIREVSEDTAEHRSEVH